jgi:GT2 family glycosyltransferase
VAFSDDDSWWEAGSLARAADHLDAAPRLALLAARMLVGPPGLLDPVCTEMAASPLPAEDDLPGPPVLGFVACGAVVRRRAYLQVGGFSELIFFGGEETLLAQDLATAGWGLAYVDDVVARHHPVAGAERGGRDRQRVRNALLSSWMRRPLPVTLRHTAACVRQAADADVRAGLADAARRLPAALAQRHVLSAPVERRVRLLERPGS